MDCQALARGGEPTASIVLCQVNSALMQFSDWVQTKPAWAVGLLFATLALVFLLWWVSHLLFARHGARSEAKRRAERLLRESITPEQYKQLLTRGYLEIPSRLYTGYHYRIPRNQQRVQIYETYSSSNGPSSRKLAELCVVACDPVPDADLVLTHKLMIEADEQSYLSIANRIG